MDQVWAVGTRQLREHSWDITGGLFRSHTSLWDVQLTSLNSLSGRRLRGFGMTARHTHPALDDAWDNSQLSV